MVTYPNDWKEDTLANIVVFKNGQAHENDISSNGKYIVVNSKFISSSGSVKKHSNKRNQPAECFDVLMVMSDLPNGKALGKCYYVEKNDVYTVNQRICSLSNSKINSKLLYYLVNRNPHFLEFDNGVTQTNLRRKDVVDCLIKYPQLQKEQKEIVEILTDFDEHIDNLTELIEKKKAIRDGALEDLVSGKTRVEGFDGEWELVSFNQVITPKARIGWQGLKKSEYLRSGHSYLIGGTDFNNGTISFDSISYVCKERYEMDSNIQVAENDVLVTKDGTIGKVAIIPQIDKPATLNSGVFVFRTTKKLESSFLFRILSLSLFRGFIDTLSAGSTIKHLYQKDLKHFEFAIPKDVNEQKLISQILTYMDEEIQALETEKYKMVQIREGAMDDLLTGRVRLKI